MFVLCWQDKTDVTVNYVKLLLRRTLCVTHLQRSPYLRRPPLRVTACVIIITWRWQQKLVPKLRNAFLRTIFCNFSRLFEDLRIVKHVCLPWHESTIFACLHYFPQDLITTAQVVGGFRGKLLRRLRPIAMWESGSEGKTKCTSGRMFARVHCMKPYFEYFQ
jgi:hypothetical protein